MIRNKKKTNSGITLIALVITIIVLLILAGVTIATLTGDNGILTKANEADVETRAATVEERINLWKTNQKADNYLGEAPTQELAELLDDLEEEKLITPEERNQIEEKGHVVIGSKDISFSDGLTEASYIITSNLDEVIFNKIITEGDIAVEKPGFESYEIEGITKTKEEEADTNPKEGNSGTLEVVGDISDATFKYTLTDFMQGDETFYCKINIDGEEYYKEMKIIQGDVVTYEEDFVGIQYTGNWSGEENENFTNGKARVISVNGSETTNPTFACEFSGTGVDYITKAIKESPVTMNTLQTIDGTRLKNYKREWDSEEDNGVYGVKLSDISNNYTNLQKGSYKFTGTISTTNATKFYLDAIIIYRQNIKLSQYQNYDCCKSYNYSFIFTHI